MGRSLLFNLRDPEEPRVAVLEKGRLAEVGVETEDRRRLQGDVFLGRVVRVEPAVQAAFVDLGLEKPGFLHVADVMSTCGSHPGEPGQWAERKRGPLGRIQDLLVNGQTLLVQVTRDQLATKGPTLTTFLSLPGQWLVLMPSLGRAGVSRRIADAEARAHAQDCMAALDLPDGMGAILRTAGAGRTVEELASDLETLQGRYESWMETARTSKPPLRLHRESGLLERTLRDWLAEEVEEVVVDTEEGYEEARRFLDQAAPPWKDHLELHDAAMPLFHSRGLENDVDRLFRRRVPLPGGGFLLFEPTEALLAVDVNSGRSMREDDLEDTAMAINLAAVEEVSRQLRLRDLGGLIVVDFIDMRRAENRAVLDQALLEAFAVDRERVRIAPVSEFGLVEMTRRRSGPSLRQALHDGCPSCRGSGVVRTDSSGALRALREARSRLADGATEVVRIKAAPGVAQWLRERRGDDLATGVLCLEEDPSLPCGGAEVG